MHKMDNLEAYTNVGLAISKINMALTKLKEAAELPECADECNRLSDELVDVIKYLFILQDKLKGDI